MMTAPTCPYCGSTHSRAVVDVDTGRLDRLRMCLECRRAYYAQVWRCQYCANDQRHEASNTCALCGRIAS